MQIAICRPQRQAPAERVEIKLQAAAVGRRISQASQTSLSMRWRSKVFHVPQGTSYSVCRVMSPSVIQVGVRFFIEGQLAASLPPGSVVDNIFRLPVMAGSKWQVEVYGYAQVDRITLAQSVKELPA